MRDMIEGMAYGLLTAFIGVPAGLALAGGVIWTINEVSGKHSAMPCPTPTQPERIAA